MLCWSKCLSSKQKILVVPPLQAEFCVIPFSEQAQDVKILDQRVQEEKMSTSRRCGLVGQSACLVNRRSWVQIPAVPHLEALCLVIPFLNTHKMSKSLSKE